MRVRAKQKLHDGVVRDIGDEFVLVPADRFNPALHEALDELPKAKAKAKPEPEPKAKPEPEPEPEPELELEQNDQEPAPLTGTPAALPRPTGQRRRRAT